MSLPQALRASPSGPLIDIVDPDLEAVGRVLYVNGRNTLPAALQTGSAINPYSTVRAAVLALAATGGTIVIAPGNYSTETLPSLGSAEWTFTNVDPHPNYSYGAIGINQVAMPALSGSGSVNLIGLRLVSSCTFTGRLQLDSCWCEAAITSLTLDVFDCRFLSTSSITMTSGMTITDSELDALVITSPGSPLCRLIDCILVTSFTYAPQPGATLRVDGKTAFYLGSVTSVFTNATLTVDEASPGSGQQIVATPSGNVGVVDISTLMPGGAYIAQPTANCNFDGFSVKQNGFYFDFVFDQASTVHIATLNYDIGATTTSMRTPMSVAYHILRNTTVRLRYQFNRWRVEVPGTSFGSISPLLINTAINRAVPFIAYRSFTAGGGGAADDVTIVDVGNLSFPVRVLDAWLHTLTPVVGSTCHVRSATGGGGTGLTSLMSSAAAGVTRNNDSTTRNALASEGLILRRSDSGVAGDITLLLVRTG